MKEDMKIAFNQIYEIMKNMADEKDEIRRILNGIDSILRTHNEGEEYLEKARKYYIEAMTKFEESKNAKKWPL